MTTNRDSAADPGLPNCAMSPHDTLCLAVSIVQNAVLAGDSAIIPEKLFGNSYIPDAALQHAAKLLAGLLPVIEDATWKGGAA